MPTVPPKRSLMALAMSVITFVYEVFAPEEQRNKDQKPKEDVTQQKPEAQTEQPSNEQSQQ